MTKYDTIDIYTIDSIDVHDDANLNIDDTFIFVFLYVWEVY